MSSKGSEKWILYSTCDEDSDSEMRALEVSAGEDVLSVTGSGCRTLSLIASQPRSVVSVDTSPGQNYLLEVKLAAIRHFDYDTLLAFLGIDPCPNRLRLFAELRGKISPEAYRYFARHHKEVRQGLLMSGRHEKFYRRVVAPGMRLLYGRAMHDLFSARTLEEQRSIYLKKVDGVLWRSLIRYGFSERVLKFVLNDPGYRITIDVGSVGGYVLERTHHTFTNHLARDNHWLAFTFLGRYADRGTLPHFLLRENYEAIRSAPTKVEIVTENLIEYLRKAPDGSLDKFSLSDVTSCIDQDGFDQIMRHTARAGRPGGRVCYRNFLAKHQVPEEAHSTLFRDVALSSSLTHDDKAFVYDVEVLTVKG
jgi:S-adenosylmethionine-diacylglycerol 3-amino-3-carboxypropyl transferase